MGYQKYAQDRHKPPGDWVQATHLQQVVGIQHRKADVLAFCRAAKKAEAKGRIYGLAMQRERDNRADQNALAIFGLVQVKPWFRPEEVRQWRLGYVPREAAADVSLNLLDQGIPVGIELYDIYIGSKGFIEVKFFILAPPGNGIQKRVKEGRAS